MDEKQDGSMMAEDETFRRHFKMTHYRLFGNGFTVIEGGLAI
jgi:hypothetical protein